MEMEKIHSVYGDSEVPVILNLTHHAATPEQVEAGVVEPTEKARVQELLTFAYPLSRRNPERDEASRKCIETGARRSDRRGPTVTTRVGAFTRSCSP